MQFSLLSLLVIVLNSVYITILTNNELSQPGVQVEPIMALELTFSAFYCLSKMAFELIIPYNRYIYISKDII